MLRVFHHYFSARKLTFFFAETAAIGLACAAGALALSALVAARATGHAPQDAVGWAVHLLPVLTVAAAFVVTFQFALYLLDLYDLKVALEDRSRGYRLLKAAGVTTLVVGGLVLAAPFAAPRLVHLPQGALLGGAMGALVGTLGVRAAMRALVGNASNVLIVGDGQRARALAQMIEEGGESVYKVAGLLDSRLDADALCAAAQKARADFVVLAAEDRRGTVAVDGLLRCRLEGRRVYDATGFSERVLRRIPVASLRASDFAFADELTVSAPRRLAKRLFDVLVSGALLALASPFLLLVAAAIKLDSRGPVFYRQERTGQGGRSYFLWKFRSMRTDAEKNGAVWAKKDDDRVTRVGRFIRRTRIDEIPQVFNVLTGDMSFVGPRPERPVFISQLKQQIPFYALREAVKPGITGWAQIRYPYGASVEDARNKLEFDLYYVKNGSLFLDVGIIFHTVRHVLLGRGAR